MEYLVKSLELLKQLICKYDIEVNLLSLPLNDVFKRRGKE